jgi:hypothetical protein
VLLCILIPSKIINPSSYTEGCESSIRMDYDGCKSHGMKVEIVPSLWDNSCSESVHKYRDTYGHLILNILNVY